MRLPKDLEAKVLAASVPAKTAPARSVSLFAAGLGQAFDRIHSEVTAVVPSADEPDYFPSCLFTLPVRVVSEMNTRGHWTVRQRRFDGQKSAVTVALARSGIVEPIRSWVERYGRVVRVDFTRYGRQLLDDDNLQGAFKACRDAVAKAFGWDDGGHPWWWKYGQEKSGGYSIAVRITTTPIVRVEV